MVGNKDSATCPLMATLGIIDGKWKASIIWYLGELGGRGIRYGKLKEAFPYRISHKVFTEQLRELERDGIVVRREYDEMPPRVEYSFTPRGDAFLQVLRALRDWGVLYGMYDKDALDQSRGIRRGNDFIYATGGASAVEGKAAGAGSFAVVMHYGDSSAVCDTKRAESAIAGQGPDPKSSRE